MNTCLGLLEDSKRSFGGQNSLETYVRVRKRELEKSKNNPKIVFGVEQSIAANDELSGDSESVSKLVFALENLEDYNKGYKY